MFFFQEMKMSDLQVMEVKGQKEVNSLSSHQLQKKEANVMQSKSN